VFSFHAAEIYLFARIVPGTIAYAGFAYLGSQFWSVRSSLEMYLAPIASALLSFVLLGELPLAIHFWGGGLILVGVWSSLRKNAKPLN
jgi:drug/metabolite transporter (DMT)-like permease